MTAPEDEGSIYSTLPRRYLDLLSATDKPLVAAVADFLSHPELRGGLFVRACQLYNTISTIEQHVGEKATNAVLLNAELVFYKMYEQYYPEFGLVCNAFMWHWLEIVLSSKGIRAEFIKALLRNRVEDVQYATPEELSASKWAYTFDTAELQRKLQAMGLWDHIVEDTNSKATHDIPFQATRPKGQGLKEVSVKDILMSPSKPQPNAAGAGQSFNSERSTSSKSEANGVSRLVMNPSVLSIGDHTQDSDFPSPTSSCTTSIDEFHDKLDRSAALLQKVEEAQKRQLSSVEKDAIVACLNTNPADLLKTEFPFSPEEFESLVANNRQLALELARILFFKVDTKDLRNILMDNLSKLTLALPSLDLITCLVISEPKSTEGLILPARDKHFLLHTFLSTALRRLEEFATTSTSSRQAHRRSVAEKVRLLCLFLRNLIVKNVIVNNPDPEEVEEMGDYKYEMQELGVRFVWVKEAKKVWEYYQAAAKGEGGLGLGGLSDVD